MRKKNRLKPTATAAPGAAPAESGAAITQAELCPPKLAFQIKLAVLIAITAFFILRLFFLAHTSAPWDDAGAIDTISRNPGKLSPVVLMRQHWSYAPAQFYLTEQLVKYAKDYTSLLFWGRLPSLLLWYGGLLLAFWTLRQVLGKSQLALSAVLTIWAAFTLRGILESSQGYNYAGSLPCSVFLLWLFVSPRGFVWMTEPKRLWIPLLAGLAAGLTGWFTYQSPFIAMGGFLMLGAVSLWQRNFAAFKGIIPAGLAFSAVIGWVWVKALSQTVKIVSVTGGSWAGGLPGDSLAEKLKFLPTAWFKVVESNFSIVLPSVASVVIATIAVALLFFGLARLVKSKRLDPVEVRALAFVALIVVIWSGLAYLKKSPLSQTRHTYILQFPLLLLLGVALKYLPVPRRVYAIGAAVIVAGFAAGAPVFWRSVKNHFDAPGLGKILTEDPNSLVLQYPGGSCLDYFLMIREHPEWGLRVADGTWQWAGYMQFLASSKLQIKAWPQPDWNAPGFSITPYLATSGSVSVYLIGVQTNILQRDMDICAANGFKVVPVQDIAPVGSVEPWRKDEYVGNGFHLYKLERGP